MHEKLLAGPPWVMGWADSPKSHAFHGPKALSTYYESPGNGISGSRHHLSRPMPATAATPRRRRPKKFLYKPKPPPEPHPFLLRLKSLPSPIAAAAALLSAPRHLHDHPFAACVLYRLARARLFPLVLPLLAALRSLMPPSYVQRVRACTAPHLSS